MRLELVLSNKNLDVCEETGSFQANRSLVRSGIEDDKFVYAEFSFAGRPGRNLPHVRVALELADAFAIIDAHAEKGDPEAERAQNAYRLASSIADFVRNSN